MEVLNWTLGTLLPNETVWSPWAHYYASLPLFPFFQTVHFILTAFTLRSERGKCDLGFMMHTDSLVWGCDLLLPVPHVLLHKR